MTGTSPRRHRYALALTLLAFALFLIVPAAPRALFSGAPFSSKAHLVVGLFLILVVAAAFFPPRRQPRLWWAAAILVCAVLKLLAASQLVPMGWNATYWTMQLTEPPQKSLYRVLFFERGPHPDRTDAAIDFVRDTFALHFVNDNPRPGALGDKNQRDVQQPLVVVWNGWTEVPESRRVQGELTANGRLDIAIDDRPVAAAVNPRNASLTPTLSAGRHRLTVRYVKAEDQIPDVHVTLPGLTITPVPASAARLRQSTAASAGILLLGIVAVTVLLLAIRDAYRPVARFALEDLWMHVDRVAAVAFFAWFVLLGLSTAIPMRRITNSFPVGDDSRSYEAQARLVLMHGLSMTDPLEPPAPYYFYPFYSYFLAGTHALFGEDYATIVLTNFFCAASLGLVAWALLHTYLEGEAVAAALFLMALFVRTNVLRYAFASFTDNLYIVMVLLVALAAVRAFERRSLPLLVLTGILTAIGGATRPSLLILLPFMLLCAALFWPSRFRGRIGSAALYGIGFAAGIAPFTMRNWIVSHKLVLIIRSYIMLPWFLYHPNDVRPGWLADTSKTFTDAVRVAAKIYAGDPLHFTWVEIQKVLFTFGVQHFDPANIAPRHLIFIPILFALAVWTGRVPRWTKIVIIFIALSHLAAMVIAYPWTYGYKTILPFHLLLGIGAAFLLPLRSRATAPVRQPRPITTAPERPTVSVVLPTYNEKDSIRQVILDFFATGAVNEVLVINNNAAPGTSEEVAGSGAREIFESRQGYGAAIRRGLREATGDYIVVCEPDGTFVARDILKLLAYADDFDAVYGSRTSQQMVLQGANMGFFLRWGNWAVAKYLEFLYNATSLTDVGCTMRLVRREVAEALADQFRIDGSQFGPEMMILTLREGYRVVQVPVNYCERVGVSAVTGDPSKALLLGLQMIWLITRHRFEDLFVRPAPARSGTTLSPSHE